MLTSVETAQRLLMQGYDPEYYNSLYRQMCYAFGEPWNSRTSSAILGDSGEIPDWPDIVTKYQEIGRSRRIINSQFIGLSRVMQADPQPDWPQVDNWVNECRKQAWNARYMGEDGADGEWSDELTNAFMDGDGLGIGWVKLGMVTNPETGFQKVKVSHSPTVQTIWDRHQKNPGRANWICFIEYLPVYEAEAIYGKKKVQGHIRQLCDGQDVPSLDVVRILEFWDIGLGRKGTPTRIVFPTNYGNEPWEVEENVYGCIPASYYLHMLPPGMRRPVGRIALQMATQEALNEIEKYLRKVLRQPSFRIADATQLNMNDLRRVNAGEQNVIVRWETPAAEGRDPVFTVPGAEAQETLLILREMLERQFNADSGVTDFDRGSLNADKRTLGENQLVDQRSQVQSSWSDYQALKFHRRTVEVASKLMRDFDRDPLMVDVFGANIMLNDPSVPQSSLQSVFEEQSKVLIGNDAIRTRDVKQEQLERLQLLQMALTPLVQGGLVNMTKYTEEVLKAIGEKDPSAWAPEPEPALGPTEQLPAGV